MINGSVVKEIKECLTDLAYEMNLGAKESFDEFTKEEQKEIVKKALELIDVEI